MAFDHSFKLTKSILSDQDDLPFSSAFTLMAGDGLVLGIWFCHDESDKELERVLQKVGQRFKRLGVSQSVIYTDDCCTRRSLFRKCFPGVIVAQSQTKADIGFTEALSHCAIDQDQVGVVTSTDQVAEAIDSLVSQQVAGMATYGLDIEWTAPMLIPDHRKTTPLASGRMPGSVATLQLASSTGVYLFQISKIGWPSALMDFFKNPQLTYVGVGVQGDVTRLKKDGVPIPSSKPSTRDALSTVQVVYWSDPRQAAEHE
jgi:hypothetical protein